MHLLSKSWGCVGCQPVVRRIENFFKAAQLIERDALAVPEFGMRRVVGQAVVRRFKRFFKAAQLIERDALALPEFGMRRVVGQASLSRFECILYLLFSHKSMSKYE